MQRFVSALLFGFLALSACSIGVSPAQPAPASPTPVPVGLPTAAVPTAHTDPLTPGGGSAVTPFSPQDCGYQWANQALPELSSSFEQSIQALQPEAQASAYAFGENCLRSDGSIASFAAMETDFNVLLYVDDLANQSVLGRWIVQVMQVIESLPADQITGPRPGRVSIVFQSSTAQSVINFYINQYRELPSGLSHAQVYQALRALQ